MGRPKGSKNKPKTGEVAVEDNSEVTNKTVTKVTERSGAYCAICNRSLNGESYHIVNVIINTEDGIPRNVYYHRACELTIQ